MYVNDGNIKSKIFFGTKANSADHELNLWLAEHTNVEIINFKYHHTSTYWHHSICILYKE